MAPHSVYGTQTPETAGDVDNRSVQANGGHGLRKNDAKGGWIVQKFGGTSIGKFPEQIADKIVRHVALEPVALWGEANWRRTWTGIDEFRRLHMKDNKTAIVCSARSTDTKAEGTTNR
jgi:aspartate kinase